jgi:hypothetical protein
LADVNVVPASSAVVVVVEVEAEAESDADDVRGVGKGSCADADNTRVAVGKLGTPLTMVRYSFKMRWSSKSLAKKRAISGRLAHNKSPAAEFYNTYIHTNIQRRADDWSTKRAVGSTNSKGHVTVNGHEHASRKRNT